MPFPDKITVTQRFQPKLSGKDRLGKPANVQDGSETFSSADESIATVTKDADGKQWVNGQGQGKVVITGSADGDLTEGVRVITGSATLTVTQGDAVDIGLDAGPIEEQP